jgi:hypothetical protein
MVAASGIGSAEQFGAPTVKLNPTPASFHSGERLGYPTVTVGAATIAPAGIPSSEMLGAPNVPGGPRTITPAGIRSAEYFGSPHPTVPTVFMIPGFNDLTDLIGWTGITSLTFQLEGKITAGNNDVAIVYNNIGFDNLLSGLGPANISTDNLTSLLAGVATLDAALHATPGPKVVYGHSLGAMLACLWLHNIGPTSTIPPAELSFVLIGNSFRRYGGLLYATQYGVPVATPYTVLDIANQYDFFADQPNLVTSPNYLTALTSIIEGGFFVHVSYFLVDPTDTTLPSFVEGNITYRLAPTLPWWEPSYALPLIESAYNRPEVLGGAVAPPIPALPQPQSFAQPAKRYPPGPITPHGAYHLLAGDTPTVKLTAYDNSIVFSMMGGESIPDRTMPECVQIKGMKGLIPPWKQIDQKGATQDGKTFVTSLYDPTEIEIVAMARGRDPQHTRQVYRDLVASIDAIQTSQLSWFTQEMGYWWSDIRWQATPADPLEGIFTNRQAISLKLRGYDAFWRSYDFADQFGFIFQDAVDDFNVPVARGLGSNWTITTQGNPGVGFIFVDGIEAIWSPDTSGSFYPAVTATTICRRNGYTSTTDNQVVTTTFTTFAGSYWANNSYNDIWARMRNSGVPGSDGVRLRIGGGTLTLSYFKAGVETVLRQELLLIPPLPGDTWTLVAGSPIIDPLGQTVIDSRAYTVLRNGSAQMTVEEMGASSQVGSAFRSAGFGVFAGQGLFNQSTPAGVGQWSAADNTTIAQSGFVTAINGGDQPMWERFTCYGPGTFNIGDGPNATEFVQFGPLLSNQVAQIRTDPRKYGVIDLSSKPPLQQDLNFWEQAVADYISFATGGNVSAQLQQIESLFGIQPPQGSLYSLLSGRFSVPVPAKSPGYPLQKYQIPVSISGGNAASAIVAAGTPLRRLPY